MVTNVPLIEKGIKYWLKKQNRPEMPFFAGLRLHRELSSFSSELHSLQASIGTRAWFRRHWVKNIFIHFHRVIGVHLCREASENEIDWFNRFCSVTNTRDQPWRCRLLEDENRSIKCLWHQRRCRTVDIEVADGMIMLFFECRIFHHFDAITGEHLHFHTTWIQADIS